MHVSETNHLVTSMGLSKLAALVGTLGSSDYAGWWNCSFLSPTGIATLEFNFPRTAISAAVSATSKAAALKHDHAAGAVGVFHLFRLPTGLTQKVHAHLVADASRIAEVIASRDLCIEALREMAEHGSTDGLGPGARNLGNFSFDDPALTYRLASSYLKAFTEDYQTFPYFTLS
ncbi:MAG: BrxE family protein [Akkermansiaceae bacterium]|nr:BrxE family protein [Akkermansiaceae bacterium]